MNRRTLLVLLAVVLAAGTVLADTKVVKKVHTDGYSLMGQSQPPQDSTVTVWIADDRLRTDQPDTSLIVRLDQKVMYVVDNDRRTYSVITLPVDVSAVMPPEMAAAMKQMMTFTAEVTVTDEVEQIGGRSARRYDLTMTSQAMQVQVEVWATKDVPFDLAAFRRMGDEMQRMQPGMEDVLPELRKIEGFQLRQTSTLRMTMTGGTEITSREEVVAFEQVEAPEGLYEPPADFTRSELDWKSMMQSGGR